VCMEYPIPLTRMNEFQSQRLAEAEAFLREFAMTEDRRFPVRIQLEPCRRTLSTLPNTGGSAVAPVAHTAGLISASLAGDGEFTPRGARSGLPRMASRMTAKASCPTGAFGVM
jgi:hypothetical protein